ncbi:MAG TPA: hypothetical protein VJA94_08360 [Candidatus Angelobacter sp.]
MLAINGRRGKKFSFFTIEGEVGAAGASWVAKAWAKRHFSSTITFKLIAGSQNESRSVICCVILRGAAMRITYAKVEMTARRFSKDVPPSAEKRIKSAQQKNSL